MHEEPSRNQVMTGSGTTRVITARSGGTDDTTQRLEITHQKRFHHTQSERIFLSLAPPPLPSPATPPPSPFSPSRT